MKKLFIASALLLVSCKPACSAVDQLQTTYAADIATISALTGWPASQTVALLAQFCAIGGEAAVVQEIANLKAAATAGQEQVRARCIGGLKEPPL